MAGPAAVDPDVATAAVPPPGWEVNLINSPHIGNHLVIVAITLACLTTCMVSLRLYTRTFIVKGLGWDDLWSFVAWTCALMMTIGDCFQVKYGTGTHLWDVTITHFNIFLKLQLVVGIGYVCAVYFAKLAICTFYLRLSPAKTFRILVYATMAFTTSYGIAAVLVIIFSCRPIGASWDTTLAALPTTRCVNRPADYLAQSILNICADLIIFVLPLPTLWHLHLPINQRLSVMAIFGTGVFVTIISMIRLKSVVHIINSKDLTWDTSPLLVWSTLEAHVTVMCACFPTLRPLLKIWFPSFLGDSTGRRDYPSITGVSHKLDNSHKSRESYAMKIYREKAESARVDTTISTGLGRRQLGDSESQEYIIGQEDVKASKNQGVYVTKTIELS